MCDAECQAEFVAKSKEEAAELENIVLLVTFFLLVTIVFQEPMKQRTVTEMQFTIHSMATANLKIKLGVGDKYHRSIKVHTQEAQNQHQLKSPLSDPNLLSKFQKIKFFKNFQITPKFFFCFTMHKKLNQSCSLKKKFLFLKKFFVSLKKTTFEIL